MSLERDIKETLMKIADDVEPGQSRFGDVENKVRRRHAAMLVGTTAFALAVIVAGAIAIPQLTKEGTPNFAGPGSTTPPVTAPDGTTYRNELDSYQTTIPDDWKVGGFEGAVEFLPPGLPGLAVGEDTFAVEIQHRIGETYNRGEPSGGAELSGFEDGYTVAGREAVRAETPTEIVYRVDWTGAGCDPEALCDAEIATLRVAVFASNTALWDQYHVEGEAIVDALVTSPGAAVPAGAVITRRGSVDGAAVAYDELTSFLVRFMDARMDGGGAEAYLSENARDQYEGREGEFGLYAYGDPAIPWTTYRVTARADADANSSEFTVRSQTTNQRGDKVILEETIAIGSAGRGGYEVRFTAIVEHNDGTR